MRVMGTYRDDQGELTEITLSGEDYDPLAEQLQADTSRGLLLFIKVDRDEPEESWG